MLKIFLFFFISGHVSFLKNRICDENKVTASLLSLGGTRMEDGRTWGHSNVIMCRKIQVSNTSMELRKLSNLKSFQVTASHKNTTSSGSSTPRLMNAASCDLENPESNLLRAVLYGGQSVDTGLTSDTLVLIKGEVEDEISKSKIEVTQYPSSHQHYTEFGIPRGWPDGSHLVQLGEVPEGRTGSKLSFFRKHGSSDMLVSIGGHCKPNYFTDVYHHEDSICLLLVPEMRWWKLPVSESCKRSFHSQTSNSDSDIFLVGGMSIKNNRWSGIHSLDQVTRIHIHEELSFTESVITLSSSIENLPFVTNFASCGNGEFIFVFSGFTYPKY